MNQLHPTYTLYAMLHTPHVTVMVLHPQLSTHQVTATTTSTNFTAALNGCTHCSWLAGPASTTCVGSCILFHHHGMHAVAGPMAVLSVFTASTVPLVAHSPRNFPTTTKQLHSCTDGTALPNKQLKHPIVHRWSSGDNITTQLRKPCSSSDHASADPFSAAARCRSFQPAPAPSANPGRLRHPLLLVQPHPDAVAAIVRRGKHVGPDDLDAEARRLLLQCCFGFLCCLPLQLRPLRLWRPSFCMGRPARQHAARGGQTQW